MTDAPPKHTVTVFVNAQRVLVPAGTTVLDAIRAWSADASDEVERGLRLVVDNRGLPTALDAPVHGGAIFRLTAARDRQSDDLLP